MSIPHLSPLVSAIRQLIRAEANNSSVPTLEACGQAVDREMSNVIAACILQVEKARAALTHEQ